MSAITVQHLTYRYGRTRALDNLELDVAEGQVFGLLGPNGSGKTTLMQILTGMRPVPRGVASVLNTDVRQMTARHRQRIGYVAEGQQLPKWMRLEQYEAYLAPLYPTWDFALATSLRTRFGLDPHQKLGALSRGTAMKAALLCALAPRPALLLMDEPFTGMDALVKDDIVRGLLDTAASEGQTTFLCSHDLAEVEALADRVALLRTGALIFNDSMEEIRERFRRVELTGSAESADTLASLVPTGALRVERAGHRLAFIATSREQLAEVERRIAQAAHDAVRVDVRALTLRDVFVAVAGDESAAVVRDASAA